MKIVDFFDFGFLLPNEFGGHELSIGIRVVVAKMLY